jgi:mRNA interferase RelE/StbE
MSDDWDWQLTESAHQQFDSLDAYARERITNKLDEIVTDQWRDPPEYLEPLQGAPHDKLRVGPFRLGCRADCEAAILYVLAIKKRGGNAYRGDDD